MRRAPTEPEKRLWRRLSNSQLGGFKFRRQAVIGRDIADFFCPSARLIVEVDGDTHVDAAADERRTVRMERLGSRVLRVTNADVMHNISGVLEHILTALTTSPLPFRGRPEGGASTPAPHQDQPPHPNPSPEGEGLKASTAMKRPGRERFG